MPEKSYPVTQDTLLLPFLRQVMPTTGGNKVKAMLQRGQVRVDGRVQTRHDYPLTPGRQVTVAPNRPPEEPDRERIRVIFEDEEFLAVDKPAGLLSVATDTEKERTAFRVVNTRYGKDHPGKRLYVVHRLDRDTSGVLLFVKSPELRDALQENWNGLVTHRGYQALVEGRLSKKEGRLVDRLFETSTHLVYQNNDRPGGQVAITNYKVVGESGPYSLLSVWLETGRKNQIRVQLQALGHPIVGDRKYGAAENPIHRLGLHANRLVLNHPVTGKEYVFETPAQNKLTGFISQKR